MVLPPAKVKKTYMRVNTFYIYTIIALTLLSACRYPKNFTRDFYSNNETRLIALKNDFKTLYLQRPFAVSFTEKTFTEVSFEFITDTVKYIYYFNIKDKPFADSLQKHQYNVPHIIKLLNDMRSIQCTWITNLDYYENLTERHLVLMAVRNKALNNTFKGESYCTLAFFERSQPADEKGIFLDRADPKRRRQINGYVLHKVNDYTGYAITKHYR